MAYTANAMSADVSLVCRAKKAGKMAMGGRGSWFKPCGVKAAESAFDLVGRSLLCQEDMVFWKVPVVACAYDVAAMR